MADRALDSAIEDIRGKFTGLHKILTQREDKLIEIIKSAQASNLSHIRDLLDMKEFICQNIKNNALMNKKLYENDLEIAELKSQHAESIKQLTEISWGGVCYDELSHILDKIDFNNNNELSNTLSHQSDYSKKIAPIYHGGVCCESPAPDQLSHPNHIAIDEKTQNIYVSDFKQNCIVIFDKKANIISKYNSGIRFPRAITCRNDKLYLIENLHSMRHIQFKSFQLNPRISPIPVKKLKYPTDTSHVAAFDVSKEEVWYICNQQSNKVFFLENSIFYLLSPSIPFESPTALKVYGLIYLLESQSKETARIRLMSLQGDTIRTIPLNGVVASLYFDVDLDGNFIISNSYLDSIVIFSKDGSMDHIIHSTKSYCIAYPKGIAVSNEGNIAVITSNSKGCLLIF
ncbi:hypothetical protein LOD99_13519 [Oopsacas minuta]|uniref:Uncharacterized protein n=1 Tax=Oopsacas minuta TaxID=111878 RepID=A0AAV7KRS3_9METZ|nr:hypothetical protein LOD99_13519 [Oopsacas minuta]